MKERLINIIEAFMLQDCGSESLRKDAVRTLNAASASPLLLDRISDKEINKCATGYYAGTGASEARQTQEIAWAKGAKWLRDRLGSATSNKELTKEEKWFLSKLSVHFSDAADGVELSDDKKTAFDKRASSMLIDIVKKLNPKAN